MGYKILSKVEVCQNQYELSIDAPYITRNAKAGQFIILRVEQQGERIPLTIADVDKESGILTIVYMAVGYTTKKLAQLNVGDEIVVMQGATTNEYDYFKKIYEPTYRELGITHEACCWATLKYLTQPTEAFPDLVVTDEFLAHLDAYFNELDLEGYKTTDEKLNELLNDQYLQSINYYMAQKQAENGGISYCYAFDEPYDGEYAKCRAGHAIDCYYFFGSFNGGKAIGTKEQVDFSRKYQDMAANFFRYGDPSTKDFKWEPYNKETGYITLLNKEDIRCIEGYHKKRINLAVKMTDENEAMKIAFPWIHMFPLAIELHYGK